MSAAGQETSGRIAGKPDFSGIWEANNTANWDLLTHKARPMVAQQGLTPGSVGIRSASCGSRLDRLGSEWYRCR